jgi:hypothetical protein
VKVAAAHVQGDAVVGTNLAVYAYRTGVDLNSRPEVERLADGLERSAHVLQQAGLTLAYHNHAMEFFRLDGELVYDIIRKKAPGVAVRARHLLGSMRRYEPGTLDSGARQQVSQHSPQGLWRCPRTRRAALYGGSWPG